MTNTSGVVNKGETQVERADVKVDIEIPEEVPLHGWRVIAAVCLNSSLNAFMCMSFSASEQTVSIALNVEEHEVATFYSAYLLAVVFSLTPIMWLGERHELLSLSLSVVSTVAAALVRWAALRYHIHPYELCMLSQALVGFGACAVSTLPCQISHQRFKPERWPLTTSMMLMANYCGWLFGSTLPQQLVASGSVESLIDFYYKQGIYSLVVVVAFIVLYRPLPERAAEKAKEHCSMIGFCQVLKAMYTQPQFSLQLVTHGSFGAVGFVVPSAAWFIFEDLGFSASMSVATDAAFIGTGVAAGVLLGAFCTNVHLSRCYLRMCYLLGALSTIACCIVAYAGILSETWTAVAIVVLMSSAGFATLGFTGIAFEDLASFPGVPSNYVLWIGYMIMLSISTPLNSFAADSWGLVTLAAVASASCFVFIVFTRAPSPTKYAESEGETNDISDILDVSGIEARISIEHKRGVADKISCFGECPSKTIVEIGDEKNDLAGLKAKVSSERPYSLDWYPALTEPLLK
eukprot:TRINITY_DN43592_c0_g1_i1.p1 TRINITY_DN43592_c0_g1~~TRINITY_DN43592_c0_g1_i1.p1  ORF type:complete len:518 (+),score=56.26 TRINITY_DN43592_c0_g1_i1:122-1675(+)